MRRRDFITLLGVAATWPVGARAQQPDRMRLIGVLTGVADDPIARARNAAFVQGLQELGWVDGRNIRIDYRWGGGDADTIRRQATELVALTPDVIFASGGPATEQLLQLTRTVPILFVAVPDPVGSGLVVRLSRPGGNATGFMLFEYNLTGKWLELLKQVAPHVTRAAVLRDPAITAGIGQFAAIQSAAPSVGIEVSAINISGDPSEIERAVSEFAREPNGGLIITAGSALFTNLKLMVALAARHKLPAIYTTREYTVSGGLISYGSDLIEMFRRAASYADRILKGEKPGELPVQAPTKYELVINLKTAKALGITVSPALLAQANEVIE